MNLTKIFGVSRGAKCALDRRTYVSLFSNVNMQVRCKSKQTRPKAIETNKYRKSEDKIGVYGYCLLASNATNKIINYSYSKMLYSKILFML